MKEESIQLLCYHNWANLKLLDHMMELPAETFTKKLNGTFPSISATFHHIYNIDQQWFKRFNPEALTKTIDLNGIEETKEYFIELHKNMKDFIRNHYDSLQVIQYENSKREVFRNSIDELIRHITNHGTYHRGNISTMIRQLGHEGTYTDYIFFLRMNG
jgi:uncharacterized damage-inducible protein DinB